MQTSPGHANITDLHRPLAQSADARLAEVVALVDSMQHRGVADALIAPLRARLQVLRPPRRLSLNRLVFMPADPVIVPAPQWRRKTPAIPRSALTSLFGQIKSAVGDNFETMSGEIAQRLSTDHKTVLRCGSQLWALAADVLSRGDTPSDWQAATGLGPADHVAISRSLAVLLRQGVAIETMVQRRAAPPAELSAALQDCMSATIAQSANAPWADVAVGMVMAVLLARLDAAAQLLTLAGNLSASLASPAARLASDMAVELLLSRAAAGPAAHPDLGEAVEALSKAASLLDAIERPGPSHRPTLKARTTQLRRELDVACRSRFDGEVMQFQEALAETLTGKPSDAEACANEAAALALRSFDLTSRAFGSAAHYDRALHTAAERLTSVAASSDGAVDRARLLEILQGPRAGIAYLRSAAGSASA